MEINNLYVLKHKGTDCEVAIECSLDKKSKKPRVISTTLVRGNIVPLQGVRRALEHYKESCENSDNEPDETA
jgi:hypothetical protein